MTAAPPIYQPAFEAFMLAYEEHGGTGLGFRKCLEAYEAAKANSAMGGVSADDNRKAGLVTGSSPATEQPDELSLLIDLREKIEEIAYHSSQFLMNEKGAATAGICNRLAEEAEDILNAMEGQGALKRELISREIKEDVANLESEVEKSNRTFVAVNRNRLRRLLSGINKIEGEPTNR